MNTQQIIETIRARSVAARAEMEAQKGDPEWWELQAEVGALEWVLRLMEKEESK